MEYERFNITDPMFGASNVYLVGETLVDTGSIPQSPDAAAPIERNLDESILTNTNRVVVTHPHVDHVGGSEVAPVLRTVPHVVYKGAETGLSDFGRYLEQVTAEWRSIQGALPQDNDLVGFEWPAGLPFTDDALDIEQRVTDGDTIQLGAELFEVMHTPGHDRHHLALIHQQSGTAITGDLVLEHGYFIRGPLRADVASYERSLRRLKETDPTRLLPGHGNVIEEPVQAIDHCLAVSERLRRDVRSAVVDTPTTLGSVVDQVLDKAVDDYARWLFTTTTLAYLEEMANDHAVVLNWGDGITIRAT
jgi:glyoxylase-like metal-dependent hydrolase (beta-lactamase superfamily II)